MHAVSLLSALNANGLFPAQSKLFVSCFTAPQCCIVFDLPNHFAVIYASLCFLMCSVLPSSRQINPAAPFLYDPWFLSLNADMFKPHNLRSLFQSTYIPRPIGFRRLGLVSLGHADMSSNAAVIIKLYLELSFLGHMGHTLLLDFDSSS